MTTPELRYLGSSPPSRRDNPFATCWTRPGAIAFHFDDGQNAEQLVARLVAQNWWGAIVGPHGSGKSTLLESLKPALAAAGCRVDTIRLHNTCASACGAQVNSATGTSTARSTHNAHVRKQAVPISVSTRPQPPRAASHIAEGRALLILDGYEQLGWLARARVTRFCRRAGAGLLVTTHAATRIPTLIRLQPGEQLVRQLVAELCAQMSTPISPADVAASYACHGSNVREIFFDLYDRHERLRRLSPEGNPADAPVVSRQRAPMRPGG